MSLERQSSRKNRQGVDAVKNTFIAAGIAGVAAAAAGSIEGSKAVIENKMEIVNTHLLTPGAIEEIKQVTGVTDDEIIILEPQLKEFILRTLKRPK